MTSSNGSISALFAPCAGNSPFTGEFPSQRPVTRSSDVFFDVRLNKRLSKQSIRHWFETPLCSSWRHYNVVSITCSCLPRGRISVTSQCWEVILKNVFLRFLKWIQCDKGLNHIETLRTHHYSLAMSLRYFSFPLIWEHRSQASAISTGDNLCTDTCLLAKSQSKTVGWILGLISAINLGISNTV